MWTSSVMFTYFSFFVCQYYRLGRNPGTYTGTRFRLNISRQHRLPVLSFGTESWYVYRYTVSVKYFRQHRLPILSFGTEAWYTVSVKYFPATSFGAEAWYVYRYTVSVKYFSATSSAGLPLLARKAVRSLKAKMLNQSQAPVFI